MGKTLKFLDHLLRMAHDLERLGQNQQAARLLTQLLTFRDLPGDVAEETRVRLAELHLKSGEFKKARRQLTAAVSAQPENAHVHYVMATAVEDDDECDPRRALGHYRRCLQLDPDNAEYLCDFGNLALTVGDVDEGLKSLRRAGELAADNIDILRRVVKGLSDVGKIDEAKRLLRIALFRNPRDRRFRDLWAQHQFQLLFIEQRKPEEPAPAHKKRGPVLLPFVRPAPADKKLVRHDAPCALPGPKQPARRRLSGRSK